MRVTTFASSELADRSWDTRLNNQVRSSVVPIAGASLSGDDFDFDFDELDDLVGTMKEASERRRLSLQSSAAWDEIEA